MTDKGWVKLYRELADDELWIDCTPVQKVVMITLLLMANHQQRKWMWRGEKFEAQPGQLVTSLESIKSKAGKGVSIKAVRTSIHKLENAGFLANESAKTGRLITIANWAKYQLSDDEGAKPAAVDGQRRGKEGATNKNVKNVRSNKVTSELAENFDKLWSLYPRKEGKKPAFTAYKKSIRDGASNRTIAVGIAAYRKTVVDTDKQFIKQGSTFFNQEIWKDFAAIAKVAEDSRPKFDARQWVLGAYQARGSVDEVLQAIQDEGAPVEPAEAQRVIAEYEASLRGEQD